MTRKPVKETLTIGCGKNGRNYNDLSTRARPLTAPRQRLQALGRCLPERGVRSEVPGALERPPGFLRSLAGREHESEVVVGGCHRRIEVDRETERLLGLGEALQ